MPPPLPQGFIPSTTAQQGLWVIVPAAGSGQRFTQSLPPTTPAAFQAISNKVLLPLPTGRSVLEEVIFRLGCTPCVTGIVVLSSQENQSAIANRLANPLKPLIPLDKRFILTQGGNTRRASVLAGLEAITLADATAQWVGIHDAARPMIDTAWLEAAFIDLKQLLGTKGVVGLCAGTKVQDTVKACVHPSASNGMMMPVITHTVDRTPLWQVQTPQLFSFSALRYAHQTVDTNISATDDAQLIELAHAGGVVIKQAASSNVKLTTWDDYQFLRHLTG